MSTLRERLTYLFDTMGVSAYQVSKDTGISQSVFSVIFNDEYDEKTMQEGTIARLTKYFGVSPEWIKRGTPSEAPEGFVEPACEVGQYSVPLLPIEAMAGRLGAFEPGITFADCESIISPIRGADYAIRLSGDSMAPEYPNGSVVLIKKIDEKVFIEWGRAYVLDTTNGSVAKVLTKASDDSRVRCVSVNPDPIYAPFEVAYSDILGVYRIMMILSLK